MTVLAGANSPLPYFALYPGGATPVNPLVGVPADRAHPPQGQILLTTVELQSRPTVLDLLFGWLDPDVDIFPEEQILGDQTPDQFRQVNLQAIDDSKDVAIAVALRRLGFPVERVGSGAIVEQILIPGSPAEATLSPGDVIVSAGGEPVSTVEGVQAAVAARSPGQTLPLKIREPDGTATSVEVGLVPCPEEVECPPGAGAVMGVALRTKDQRFNLPFEVRIESQDIGGPSAGLAFALTVIDLLTPGELTGGRRVAVTGAINIDGNIVPIGGVGQKAAAVTDAGVEVFLVPESNAAEAQAHAGENLLIIPVANLESALVALGRIGGDLSALGPPR
ncbi:MAG: PDZ domain-containing protein [Actinobacteria bacterium]|nr:PDZ domain-containing protein [Actinomycetota bacterium]